MNPQLWDLRSNERSAEVHDQGRDAVCFCPSLSLLHSDYFVVIGLGRFPRRARDTSTVCADPDNMPFSNIQQRGFENRIAELVAADLGAHLTYVWQRMGRGFVREYWISRNAILW